MATVTYGATLDGSVRDSEGNPLAARISVMENSSGVALETHDTDGDGSSSIEVDSGALVAVAASATDYRSQEIDLTGGIPSGSLRFTLRKQRLVQGAITDESGQGVGGASVRGRDPDSLRAVQTDHSVSDVTDADGGFVIAVADGGSGRSAVDAEADGWVPSSTVFGNGSVGST